MKAAPSPSPLHMLFTTATLCSLPQAALFNLMKHEALPCCLRRSAQHMSVVSHHTETGFLSSGEENTQDRKKQQQLLPTSNRQPVHSKSIAQATPHSSACNSSLPCMHLCCCFGNAELQPNSLCCFWHCCWKDHSLHVQSQMHMHRIILANLGVSQLCGCLAAAFPASSWCCHSYMPHATWAVFSAVRT